MADTAEKVPTKSLRFRWGNIFTYCNIFFTKLHAFLVITCSTCMSNNFPFDLLKHSLLFSYPVTCLKHKCLLLPLLFPHQPFGLPDLIELAEWKMRKLFENSDILKFKIWNLIQIKICFHVIVCWYLHIWCRKAVPAKAKEKQSPGLKPNLALELLWPFSIWAMVFPSFLDENFPSQHTIEQPHGVLGLNVTVILLPSNICFNKVLLASKV